jgi:HlyD family secretion protein
VLSLPIQALTLHDPATDNAKNNGGVQAASAPAAGSAKPNPVQGVFIAQKDPHGRLRAKFVPVTTGITGTTDIEVLSGLSAGDEVVTGPYKTLRDLKGGALLKRDTTAPVTTSTSSS